MKYKNFLLIFTLIAVIGTTTDGNAAYKLKNGHFVNANDVATGTMEQHYRLGMEAMEGKYWRESLRQFRMIAASFSNNSASHEALYFLGYVNLQIDELETASKMIDRYLKGQDNPRYFEEAIQCKYEIAEKYRNGSRRRLFGMKQMPKWKNGKDSAIILFNEVITALPGHDLTAKALYSKALLFRDSKLYNESVADFQGLIKRFPKHELAPESYFQINQIYVTRSQTEVRNPDLLILASINLERFINHFPGDERLDDLIGTLREIEESSARGLYDTGRFYERTKKPRASALYYTNVLHQYPKTETAEKSKERLIALKKADDDIKIPEGLL
jgi:outer membrane protein assembly factor BamD (BamD/ComL family)